MEISFPTQKNYTHCLNRHQTCSRTDYILFSPDLFSYLNLAEIGFITWSDYAYVPATCKDAEIYLKLRQWKLSNLLLIDAQMVKYIENKITEYFHFNSTGDLLEHIVWDPLKPIVRGHFISIAKKGKNLKS